MNVAICDDSPQAREDMALELKRHLEQEELNLRLFESPSELLEAASAGEFIPELALLDIVLKDESGITLASKLNSLLPDCGIIYVSSYSDFALDVYDTRHSYYILKSQLAERMGPALKMVLGEMRKKKPVLSFREGAHTRTLPLSSVLYLERNLKKTLIYTEDGSCYRCSLKPSELLSHTERQDFIQCHQSFYVNAAKVRDMSRESFTLSDGSEVPISRRRQTETRDGFFDYLSRNIS